MNKHNNTSLAILFGISVLCLFYGMADIYVSKRIDVFIASILSIGILSLGLCLLVFKKKRSLKTINWQKYGFIVLIVVLFSVLLLLLNAVAIQFNVRFDMTKLKQHTLTKGTKNLVGRLPKDIRMTVLYGGMVPKYIEDLLAEYERISQGKIKTEIIDPLVDLGYAAQFGSIIKGKERKVVVQADDERRDIDFTEEFLTEELLNNAIIRVTRNKRNACFLTGHQEFSIQEDDNTGLSILDKLLTSNNIFAKEFVLGMVGQVPEDCDVLIIAGAKQHLLEREVDLLQEYLKKGGDALFLIEHTVVTTPDVPLTDEQMKLNPSLNEVLGKWGLRIASDVVVDVASHASGDVGSPATRNYMPHQALIQGLDYTFYIRPRSIAVKSDRPESVKAVPFVLTASKKNSWGEKNRMLDVKFDELDRPGPVPISYVLWEPKADKSEEANSDTRMIVFTDADFMTNAYIGEYSNAQMALNIVNWLTEVDFEVFVSDKKISVERLDLTSQQKRQVAIILFAMPVFIATLGMMVWLRRN